MSPTEDFLRRVGGFRYSRSVRAVERKELDVTLSAKMLRERRSEYDSGSGRVEDMKEGERGGLGCDKESRLVEPVRLSRSCWGSGRKDLRSAR